eukprot:6120996-Prymnesium_polylepis.2
MKVGAAIAGAPGRCVAGNERGQHGVDEPVEPTLRLAPRDDEHGRVRPEHARERLVHFCEVDWTCEHVRARASTRDTRSVSGGRDRARAGEARWRQGGSSYRLRFARRT